MVDGAPTVFPKTLRMFPPIATAESLSPVAAASSPTGAASPRRGPAQTDDSPFSEQILNWMKQGDRLAEAKPPEVIDLSDLSDPVADPAAARATAAQQAQRRSLVRKRARRWLTVGAVVVAGCAGVAWAIRPSENVDRPVYAAAASKTAQSPRPATPPVPPAPSPGARSDAPPAATGAAAAKLAAAPAISSAARARHHAPAAKRVKGRAGTRPALVDRTRGERDQNDGRGPRPAPGGRS